MFSAITRPSPIPLRLSFFLSYKNPKSLNNLFWSSYSIPIPVSITEICKNFFYSLYFMDTSILT
jgi:hypothetical protein